MAISIRSETTGSGNGNISDQISVTKPSSVSNNDYLVVVMGANDDAPNLAAPVDWTQGDRVEGGTGSDCQIGIWYKKITDASSEPSAYTFTVGSGDYAGWWIGSLSGVDLVTPQDETMSGNAVYLLNNASPAAPSITTATSGAFVLAGWMTVGDSDMSTTLPGGSWATRADDLIAEAGFVFNCVSQTFASAGGTGDVSITAVSSTAETSAGQWAFRPDATNPSPSVSDSTTPADSVTVSIPKNYVSITDSTTPSDTPTASIPKNYVSVSDSTTPADSVNITSAYAPLAPSVTDNTTPQDSAIVSIPKNYVSVSDSTTPTDSPVVSIPKNYISVSDSSSPTDTATALIPTNPASVSDSTTPDDTNYSVSLSTVIEELNISLSDDTTPTDEVSLSNGLLIYIIPRSGTGVRLI